MEQMFGNCEGLIKVNLSSFNIAKANIGGMFYQCTKLEKEGIITKDNKILVQFENDTKEDDYDE